MLLRHNQCFMSVFELWHRRLKAWVYLQKISLVEVRLCFRKYNCKRRLKSSPLFRHKFHCVRKVPSAKIKAQLFLKILYYLCRCLKHGYSSSLAVKYGTRSVFTQFFFLVDQVLMFSVVQYSRNH